MSHLILWSRVPVIHCFTFTIVSLISRRRHFKFNEFVLQISPDYWSGNFFMLRTCMTTVALSSFTTKQLGWSSLPNTTFIWRPSFLIFSLRNLMSICAVLKCINYTTFSIQKCSGSSFNWGTQFPKLPRKFRAGFEIQSMKVALILIPIDSGQHLNGMRNTKWSRTLKWSWSWLLLQCGSGFLDWVHVYSILSWFEIVYKSCIQKDVYWELMSKFTPWIIPVISTSLLVAWKESIWRIN